MRHILFASAVALSLGLPQSSNAQCRCFGSCVPWRDFLRVDLRSACPVDVCGPWYNYFPPQNTCYGVGPVVYPHWPQQPMAAPMHAQMYNPYNAGFQNVSYYSGVPSYWYGR